MSGISSPGEADRWLALLEAVTAAPMCGARGSWPGPSGGPVEQDAVHRLVIALWWAANADRFDDLRDLHREAAVSLDVVAPSCGQGLLRMRDQADHYRRLADRG